MPYPYLMMTLLFASLAVLAALDSSLASLNLLPWFNGLRWLRVHLITLGTLTELFFGLLPVLVAARARQARPRMRWDIWLVLNAGLLFIAYMNDPGHFITLQNRLGSRDLLNEYIRHIGSAIFAIASFSPWQV